MTLPPSLPTTLLGLFSLGLPGCMAVDNDRHTIGRAVPIETVATSGDRGRGVLPADGPSLAGADRSNWHRTEFLVPIDGTYHGPQYRFLGVTPIQTERQRGIDPSPLEALELNRTNGEQAGEVLAEPFVAAAEILAMVPRMFIDPPWVAVRSPGSWPYQRTRSNYDPPDAVETVDP